MTNKQKLIVGFMTITILGVICKISYDRFVVEPKLWKEVIAETKRWEDKNVVHYEFVYGKYPRIYFGLCNILQESQKFESITGNKNHKCGEGKCVGNDMLTFYEDVAVWFSNRGIDFRDVGYNRIDETESSTAFSRGGDSRISRLKQLAWFFQSFNNM